MAAPAGAGFRPAHRLQAQASGPPMGQTQSRAIAQIISAESSIPKVELDSTRS